MMPFEARTEDDVAIIGTSAIEMSYSNSGSLQEVVRTYLDGGCRKFVIDLSHVHDVSSSGLRSLLASLRLIQQSGARLVLVAPKGKALEALSMTGFDDIFEIVDTVEEAGRILAGEVTQDSMQQPLVGDPARASVRLTSGERQRFEQEYSRLQQQYDELTNRISLRDKQISRSLDLVEKQILEEEQTEWVAERERIAARMTEIELSLGL